ncbi:MAG: DUF2760 domain-containing protein [Pseudomonadota bacterium]
MGRIGLAFRCFFRVLSGKSLPNEALMETHHAPRALPRTTGSFDTGKAVQLLALLQKEGRLLDFFKEEIDAYEDTQIGAAVRNIHRDCRSVLEEHLTIQPVLEGEEDTEVTIESGFDPLCIRLIGNVEGDPPFTGILRHHGWRVTKANLPDLGNNPMVIAPAEVEIR